MISGPFTVAHRADPVGGPNSTRELVNVSASQSDMEQSGSRLALGHTVSNLEATRLVDMGVTHVDTRLQIQ